MSLEILAFLCEREEEIEEWSNIGDHVFKDYFSCLEIEALKRKVGVDLYHYINDGKRFRYLNIDKEILRDESNNNHILIGNSFFLTDGVFTEYLIRQIAYMQLR